MPIFEYECLACGNPRFVLLVGVVAGAKTPSCPRCGSEALKKHVSRFARLRSDDDQMEQLAEAADGINPNDAGAVQRLLGDMAGRMGDEMTGDDLDAVMHEAAGD